MTTPVSTTQLPVEQFVCDLHRVCSQFDVARAKNRKLMRGGLRLDHRAGLEAALVATDVQRISRTSKSIR